MTGSNSSDLNDPPLSPPSPSSRGVGAVWEAELEGITILYLLLEPMLPGQARPRTQRNSSGPKIVVCHKICWALNVLRKTVIPEHRGKIESKVVGQLEVDIADKSGASQPNPPRTYSLLLISTGFPSVFCSFAAEFPALTFYEHSERTPDLLESLSEGPYCGLASKQPHPVSTHKPPLPLRSQN